MELFGWDLLSVDFWSILLTIVFIDLLLAGDNAIVIGLAARNLPKNLQKQAVIWGTAGAVIIRIVATMLVVSLLKIPFLLAIGGILLLWIAYKLLVQENSHGDIKANSTLWAAIRTIVIADAAMGLDNVIAVAGAAHGDYFLVILGLIISIPIVVWGSTLFIKIIEKYAWIIYIGSGVLAYTAAKMITHEGEFKQIFIDNPVFSWIFIATLVVLVIVAGVWTNAIQARKAQQNKTLPPLVAKESRESH
ncbi:TerC family protein [Cohnella cholangitidis]|uniref:TerC family protein n=1 Tax=Cohnella cholangitidis TaxID=2598458 RepID=A0A7G5BTX4_9BACL|nr:TerC family protein [Cohnella cholangitidis]QMV40408.1 TerC family protein [Cohnella cholangitidis]